MKIGFDIGGVISKYPQQMLEMIEVLSVDHGLFIITDMHPKEKVLQTLIDNGLYCTRRSVGLAEQTKPEYHDKFYRGLIHPDNVYSADYEKYGNMAKAVLIRDLKLDIFVDDFDGYLQWDSSLGPQPILLKVMPDAFRPYYNPSWVNNEEKFGRNMYYKCQ